MTHHVKATVQGPGFSLQMVTVTCALEHGFDAMNVVINEIANTHSLTAAEVLRDFVILHMSVIRV